MNVQRAERARDYVSGPEPEETKSKATAAQRATERMASWIQAAPAASVPPLCGFKDKTTVAACGTETIPGATLFVQGAADAEAIDANDIRQGRNGDCHLLGAALAMLQSPQGRARMREIIKEVQRDGRTVYEVTFRMPIAQTLPQRISGAPPYKEMKVEVGQEFVKHHAGTGDDDGGRTEVWPLVLEAGYAQLFGGHEKINGGSGALALAALTGKPTEEETLEKGLFSYSASNLKKDFAAHKPMCLAFIRQVGTDKGPLAVPKFGAYGKHCYAVTDVYERNGETYVQLKNPWGHTDPKPIPLGELEGLKPQVYIGQLP